MKQQKLSLSVFIIAQDEEDRIPDVIKSVISWADEVIVVDSGSKDRTLKISKELGASVFENTWPGYGPQKRFAEDLCKNKWVLNLDADEVVTPELAQEIQDLFKYGEPDPDTAYCIKIESVYPVYKTPGRFPFTYRPVRLYNLASGRYSESPIHDRVIFKSDIHYKQLKASIHHYCIRSLSHLIDKTNRYSELQTQTFVKEGRKISPLRLLVEFPVNFLIAYFGQKHFLRGWYGFILAHHYAFNRFMRVAKLWEAQQVIKKKDQDT